MQGELIVSPLMMEGRAKPDYCDRAQIPSLSASEALHSARAQLARRKAERSRSRGEA